MKTMVRDPQFGQPLLCCWDDCERPGYDEIRGTGPSDVPGQALIYIFCTDRHKALWLASPRGYGRLPSGERTPGSVTTG